jgi:hypothetical protein
LTAAGGVETARPLDHDDVAAVVITLRQQQILTSSFRQGKTKDFAVFAQDKAALFEFEEQRKHIHQKDLSPME